jgi:hypothetical protein
MIVVVNPSPIVTTVVTNETCNTSNNGIIAVTASGPNNGYNVSWTGTATGNPVGTEIATSGGSYSLTNLNAGNYVMTVTNAAGCSTTTAPLIASSSATTILCAGESATVTVTAAGGTAPYTGTGTFTVTAGTYSYTVTDANGCTATTTVTITEPLPIFLPAINHN